MTKRLRLEPEATEELRAAVQWYEVRRAGLGGEFLAEIHRVLQTIQEHSAFGTPAPGVPEKLGARRIPVRRFPYSIAFLELENEVRVLAIAHHRRRPGYWLNRLA